MLSHEDKSSLATIILIFSMIIEVGFFYEFLTWLGIVPWLSFWTGITCSLFISMFTSLFLTAWISE
jgi:hypothetical protein